MGGAGLVSGVCMILLILKSLYDIQAESQYDWNKQASVLRDHRVSTEAMVSRSRLAMGSLALRCSLPLERYVVCSLYCTVKMPLEHREERGPTATVAVTVIVPRGPTGWAGQTTPTVLSLWGQG